MQKIKATLVALEPIDGGQGIALKFHTELDGRSGTVSPGFDPWTAKFALPRDIDAIGTPEFAQWGAVQCILQLQPGIEAGNRLPILQAIALVARSRLVMPTWLADAFLKSFMTFEKHEVATLDQAFEHAPPTERTRVKLRDRKYLMPEVSRRLIAKLKADPSTAIDISLFEVVGKSLGIGKTLCREIYDEGLREHGYQDLKEWKRVRRDAKSPPK